MITALLLVASLMPSDAMLDLLHPASSEPPRWILVNDGVMGGVSRSRIGTADGGHLVFTGELSLENNGGFASTRALLPTLDLEEFDAFELEVRGDGRTYQLRVRTDERSDGLAYRNEFDTQEGVWTTIRLPLDEFVATFRGRTFADEAAFDRRSVRQVGFLLADGRPGPFELEVRALRAVHDKSDH